MKTQMFSCVFFVVVHSFSWGIIAQLFLHFKGTFERFTINYFLRPENKKIISVKS